MSTTLEPQATSDDALALSRAVPAATDVARWARVAVLAVPVVFVAWMGWRHRWTADDGFINFRIVRQIEQGHGPVFNAGDRVEVGTSPLWIGVLLLLDVVAPLRLEWLAVFGGLVATSGAVAVAILGTRRALHHAYAVGGLLLPLGALVYVALPPAWDFATSGLETGIGLLWLAVSWGFLCRRVAGSDTRAAPPWFVPVVLGLGPLVRPDFAIFSVAFVVALLWTMPRRAGAILRVLALAAAAPMLTELVRMAYYGSIVPNTAVAKEASLANWAQGWAYFEDFVGTYVLLLPVLALLAWFVIQRRRAPGPEARRFGVLAAVVVGGALVHALYITRVGGDFMHARMLLPTAFTVLLPVSVVEVRRDSWGRVATIAVVGWAVLAALWLRPPYSAGHGAVVFDAATGIADERLYWIRTAHQAHPVTIDEYLAHHPYARAGAAVRRAADGGRRGLLLNALADQHTLLPLAPGAPGPIVASAPALGLFGYAAGDDVVVVDDHGLASTLAAHQRLTVRGRPGHEKALAPAWFVAEFTEPGVALPPSVDPGEVAAARRALRCVGLRDLVTRPREALDPAQLLDDLGSALPQAGFRFAADPVRAEHEVCRE